MSILSIVGIALAVGGFFGVVFIIFKKIPTLVKLQEIQSIPSAGIGESIKTRLKGIRYSSWRSAFLEWLEKNLRKLRVSVLKIDNLFTDLIKKSRERSDVWKIRSSAWMEHTRLKKREKMQVLENLDKVELSESLAKITQEVAKDEDRALKEKIEEKIETLANGHVQIEPSAAAIDDVDEPEDEGSENSVVGEDEKKYIDMIAVNPKDAQAYRGLGFIYLNQKNYSDARACFRRALKLNPQDSEVANKLNEIKGLRSKKTK